MTRAPGDPLDAQRVAARHRRCRGHLGGVWTDRLVDAVSLQRRRGTAIRLWGTHQVTDKRGNVLTAMDPDSAWDTKGWVIPQRSQKAEVPGQVQINVITVGIPVPTVELDVNVWAHAEYDGKQWDTVSPPAYHHGTRLTRHWTIELRERPS